MPLRSGRRIFIHPRLWVSETIRELANLGCQDTQTGNLHSIDMYHSCGGGGGGRGAAASVKKFLCERHSLSFLRSEN